MFHIDEELIIPLTQKQKQAYEIFYTKTVDTLFRYLQAHYFLDNQSIEDILSEFYLKFWRVIHKYDKQFKFESYVRVVFKNVIKDYFRKHQHQYNVSHEEVFLQE